jgi:serine/threonine-protein kinase
MPAPTPVGAGRYEIEGEIARGGMGAVLRARDPELRRSLAVKVLLERHRGKAELERRFLEEAQITGQLQHPGIPPVHEVGRLPDGRPFFAMKLVKGRTLADLLRERPAPADDLPRWLAVFEQVCQTLAYAHAKGVIHRDLKPANVMVGAFGEVQVMDWGLAKVLGDEPPAAEEDGPQASAIATLRTGEAGLSSQAGAVIGTPAYMAPEQARGEVRQIDARCDVFGLGALLCEILTGQPPYVAGTGAEVRTLAMIGDLGGALARLDGCGADPELVALARACLAPRAAERLPDAGAVDKAVTAYLSGVQEKLRRAELERAAAALRAVEERKRRRLTAVLAAVALAAVVLVGVCWRWVELARTAAREQTAVQVNHELGRAASLRDRARAIPLTDADKRKESAGAWDEALAAAEKAEAVLEAGPADPETRQKCEDYVAALRAEADDVARDRALLERLEAAREMRAAITDEDQARTSVKAVIVFGHAAAGAYAAAFRDYGIDVLTLEPQEAARRIAERSRVSVALAAALDDWLALEVDQPVARRLLAVSREVDPEPYRNRLRAAVADADAAALKQLAREAPAADLPVPTALLLADGLHLAGELGEAVEVLRAARRRHPDDFWVNDILGVFLYNFDPSQSEEAATCFNAALALRPASHFVWDNLGGVLGWECRWADAVRAYETAGRLNDDFLKARLGVSEALAGQGDTDKALAVCQDVVRRKPDFLAGRLTLARLHVARGDGAAALAEARRLVEAKKDHPFAYLVLGEALLANNQAAEAVTAYREALRLAPRLGPAHLGLGRAYLAAGDLAGARQSLREALAAVPNWPDVHFALTELYVWEGRTEEARAACRRGVSLRPWFWGNQAFLGDFLLSTSSPDEAIAAYREAIRLRPDYGVLYNRLGNALYKDERWDEAVAAYERAVRLSPEDPAHYHNLGNILRVLGRFAEAQTVVARGKEVVQKHGGDTAVFDSLMQRCQRLAVLEPKRQDILAGRVQPASAAEAFDLALFCYYTGHPAPAVPLFRRAFTDAPDLAAANSARVAAGFAALKAAAEADAEEAARLRRQALDWFRDELALLEKRAAGKSLAGLAGLRSEVNRWRHHPTLAGVREKSALANLPAAERAGWQKFWKEAAAAEKREK